MSGILCTDAVILMSHYVAPLISRSHPTSFSKSVLTTPSRTSFYRTKSEVLLITLNWSTIQQLFPGKFLPPRLITVPSVEVSWKLSTCFNLNIHYVYTSSLRTVLYGNGLRAFPALGWMMSFWYVPEFLEIQ